MSFAEYILFPVHSVTQHIVDSFAPLADPAAAVGMRAYMKDNFPFLGISAPARDAIIKPLYKSWTPTTTQLKTVSRELWAMDEREYHYAAARLIRRFAGKVEPVILDTIVFCAQRHSWWDTIDELTHAVGDVVARYPQSLPRVESWLTGEDFWLARLAILHQLGYQTVDLDRLARFSLARAADKEFFIRKAIGWALRDASYQHPNWVCEFIADNQQTLSPLSQREGLKAINRIRERTQLTPAKQSTDSLLSAKLRKSRNQ